MLVELSDTGKPYDLTCVRFHELALQRWLNQNFYVTEGYPVPVLFTAPMDAYAHFSSLWKRDDNPFNYLLSVKGEDGKPLYEPHPSPARYPIFSVHRKGWRPRINQSYSIHQWRRLGWPTVKSSGTVSRQDLGNVMVAQMPLAIDFPFQVDFFCRRPDTMAVFVNHLMRKLRRTGGQLLQTWMTVAYPFYGAMFARTFIEGDIAYMTPEEPENDVEVTYRVSVSFVMEGWHVDLEVRELPTLWTLVTRGSAEVAPDTLEELYTITEDLRVRENTNVILAGRDNVPPFAEISKSAAYARRFITDAGDSLVTDLGERIVT